MSTSQRTLSTMGMASCQRIALVTGAAQGIGRAVAIRLAEDGLDIALNDIHTKRDLLQALSSELNAKGRRSSVVCADVSVEEEVKWMIDTVVDELGGLDVVCEVMPRTFRACD